MTDPDRLAVIFDVDGVLVDSYRAHFQSWQLLMAEELLSMSEAEFLASFGRTSPEVIRELWGSRLRDEAEVVRLDLRKEALYRQLLEDDFPAMDGAVELIDSLAADSFSLAVGSSGPPENVALVLAKLARRDRFGAVVTGRDVTRGKPDPHVFRLAAERLGVSPARCVVIEDAAAGIRAGHAAGMRCVGLASTGHTRDSLSEADTLVDSLREVSVATVRELLARA